MKIKLNQNNFLKYELKIEDKDIENGLNPHV